MRYYIYVYWQQGNIGAKQVDTLEQQPKEGFETGLKGFNSYAKMYCKHCKTISKLSI